MRRQFTKSVCKGYCHTLGLEIQGIIITSKPEGAKEGNIY